MVPRWADRVLALPFLEKQTEPRRTRSLHHAKQAAHNSLTGNIPTNLARLAKLQALWLDGNQLSGSIPETFVNLQNLGEFSVQGNRLSGDIPDFSILRGLYYLDVSYNCFDLSAGSEARAVLDKLLAAGREVHYDPQRADCVALTLSCSGDLVVPADPDQCGAVVNFPAPTTEGASAEISVVCQPPPGSLFSVGVNAVSCLATDANGVYVTCSFTVQVEDREPPAIQQVTAAPSLLWPPNHQMVSVKLTVVATDNCGAAPCHICSVYSNEAASEPGQGDGEQAPDWEITGDLTLDLKAERSGKATDRIYTVCFKCGDAAGNVSQGSVHVVVPHDRQSK